MVLHVHGLLRLVQGLETSLEESALHLVIGLFVRSNLQSGLIVTNFAGFPQNGDVGWWINLLEDHLELVQKSQSISSLLFHDLVHLLGIKLDVKVPESGLQLLKVLHLGTNVVLGTELWEIFLLVELV